MFCAISGEIPEEPVITKNGHVYERRLIEKYIRETGKCPVTEESLTENELIPVKTNKFVKPRPPTATSVPSLLATFQMEWDALMLEMYQLKKQHENARQELAHALYEHDAACRVIARLVRERDEARELLASYEPSHHKKGKVEEPAQNHAQGKTQQDEVKQDEMDVDEPTVQPLDVALVAKISAKAKELSEARKQRSKPSTLATEEQVKSYAISNEYSNILSGKASGITSMDSDDNVIVLGGSDKNVHIIEASSGSKVQSLKGHTKKIVSIALNSDWIISGSDDKTVRIWKKENDEFSLHETISIFSESVSGVAFHPEGSIMFACSLDGSWAIIELETGECKLQYPGEVPIHAIKVHPDGFLAAIAVGDHIKILDIKKMVYVADLKGHQGTVTDISFSENGYSMASVSEDGTLKLWDLRKVQCTKTLNLGQAGTSVSFDHYGAYVAASSGSNVKILAVKAWTVLCEFEEHSKNVTRVKFSYDAEQLYSCGLDNQIKIMGIAK